MERDRFQEAKRVFLSLQEFPAAERGARLHELCGGDREVEAEVESLLANDGKLEDLERPISERVIDDAIREQEPTLVGLRIGRFEILAPIAAGGMGSVWAARQDQPRRTVALKVMRRGFSFPDTTRRFEQEVEMLGRLRHPGIAQIYEAGTFSHAGRQVPYFAMEYVDGACTLDRWIERRKLSLRERVELFAQVCDAVSYGHQRGVVHRDLKPSNVLVDPDGRPKVIDFGVARATDTDVAATTIETRVGEIIGTLQYMSPEQWSGDPKEIDTRSDVYSLGVVLYEISCGRLPYSLPTTNLLEAARAFQAAEPVRPSIVERAVRGDLEAIVLKALERARERRYSSVADLTADLRRWLAGEPVQARRPGPWRRLTRWIAVHPLAATAVACTALVLAAALSAWIVYAAFLARPARLELSAGADCAILRSRAGVELVRWDTEPGSLRCGMLVDRAAALGGGAVIVLSIDNRFPGTAYPGELCFYDAEEPDRPYWTSAGVPLVLPPRVPERKESGFAIENAIAADIFPDLDGLEIVALHRLTEFSQVAVRVYSLSGRLLYEAWHDGAIEGLVWLDEAGLLVVSGLNSEERLDQMGFDVAGTLASYPAVVFALRPEVGRTACGDFVVAAGAVHDPTLAWYRWLGPANQIASFQGPRATVTSSTGQWCAHDHVRASFIPDQGFSLPLPILTLFLDREGQEVGRVVTDAYQRHQLAGELPLADVYRLMEYSELPLTAAAGPR